MAFNKSKNVEAAQKLLNQGKVPQAIAEYQQILKYEPRDQVTLMTIGELYIRQGETFQAIEYFERLAQLFVSDGFLTKAIAVMRSSYCFCILSIWAFNAVTSLESEFWA